ncbi:MAG: Arc family DNA-binding protein [Clostridia bacterium]|nr:Arc family DNA-binding protein [Clostridia bacterium]
MSKSTDYKNKFIAQKYDRINLTVPKGLKEEISQRAEELGLSVNGYLNALVKKDFESHILRSNDRRREMDVFLL